MEVNIERMEFARGASTITQQLAKNLYLSPSKNPIRKLRELLIARRLEAELTKQRILELYLNVIEWGDGIYGAEAAARTYFRKSAAELAPPKSALLAAAIINPRVLNPGHPTPRLRAAAADDPAADGGGDAAAGRRRSRSTAARADDRRRRRSRAAAPPALPGGASRAAGRPAARSRRKPPGGS